jgi:glutamine synthetase type III
MNTILAESLDYIATKLEKAVGNDPAKLNGAVQKVLEEIMAEHGGIVFNGDGYSEAWHKEADRSAACRTCVRAWKPCRSSAARKPPNCSSITACSLRVSLHSRMEVYIEQYCLSVSLEARTAIEMAKTIIFPAAIRYQGELATTCASLKAVGYVFDTDTLDKVTGLVKDLQDGIAKLETLLGRERRPQQARSRKAPAQRRAARDGGGAQDRRYARGYRRGRLVAVGHLPGNAVHHVEPLATDRRHKRVSNKIRGAIGRAVESRQPGGGARRLLAWRG